MKRIYADHAATSPLLAEASEAMRPWLADEFGNPSSLYEEGRRARAAIDQSREIVSSRLGCLFAEAIFTSSGTEAANLAILGAALQGVGGRRNRVLFGATEHHCVLHTKSTLAKLGFVVESIPVDSFGVVDLDRLAGALAEDVLLVSVMHANNELGTIQPVREVSDLTRRVGALYHCDAVQTFTGLDWKMSDLGADLVTLSAHKLGGPKGVGAITIRSGVKLHALTVGGGQEREVRAGTENVAGIVGFGAAVGAQSVVAGAYSAKTSFLRALEGSDAHLTLPPEIPCLPGHAHLRFAGVSAETLLIRLDRLGVSASAGAACSSGSLDPSHVLMACGYSVEVAKEGVRFSFGRRQAADEGFECGRRLLEAVSAIRGV